MGWFSWFKIGKGKSRPDPERDDSGDADDGLDTTAADRPPSVTDESGSPETAAGRSRLEGPQADEKVAAARAAQEPQASESPDSRGPSPNLPQMYKTWVELEETIGAARDGMQAMLANRHRAAASREEARETMDQAEAAWLEARRLGEVTWTAFDRGFNASLPGVAERLRTIKEVDEARRAQADLRRASKEAAWEEADRARQKATAGLLKAIASLASAAVQVEREMRESVNLSSVAESLRNSALEDLRGAQAIGSELALMGQDALDQVRRGSIPGEVQLDEGSMHEPVAPGLGIQREPVSPLRMDPDDSEGTDTPSGTGGSKPRRRRETQEQPASAGAEEPVPPVGETGGGAPTATEKAETPSQSVVVEAAEPTAMSAAEQLRREFAAGAFPHDPSEGAAPVSPTRGAGQRGDRSGLNIEVPNRPSGTAAAGKEPAAKEPAPAGAKRPAGAIPMPASPEPEAGDGHHPAATDEAAPEPLPSSYSGRFYVMFPSTLGQEEIAIVWEILEDIAAGTIVEKRLVSREAGIQFTLDLGTKVFSLELLLKRMPGAKLEALAADRLKVDWPRTG